MTCSDGKAFIGWGKASTAGATESNWVNEGSTYSTNAKLTLYAQWYDVNTLESWYTQIAQAGDLKLSEAHKPDDDSAIVQNIVDPGGYTSAKYTGNCATGYTQRAHMGTWWTGEAPLRPYRIALNTMGLRNTSSSYGYSGYEGQTRQTCSYNRSSTTYATQLIDTRINRLKTLQTGGITYSEIQTKSANKDNFTVNDNDHNGAHITLDTNYRGFHLGTGYMMVNASTNGAYSKYAYQNAAFFNGNVPSSNVHSSYSSSTSVIKHTVWQTEVISTKSTSGFTVGTTKGYSRYNALVALNNAKNNYFPASYIRMSRVDGTSKSLTAWQYELCTIPLTISSGKILGIDAHGVMGTSGPAYTSITRAYVSNTATTAAEMKSGSLTLLYWGANTKRNTSTGNATTSTYPYAYVLFVSSSSTLTVGTKSCSVT